MHIINPMKPRSMFCSQGICLNMVCSTHVSWDFVIASSAYMHCETDTLLPLLSLWHCPVLVRPWFPELHPINSVANYPAQLPPCIPNSPQKAQSMKQQNNLNKPLPPTGLFCALSWTFLWHCFPTPKETHLPYYLKRQLLVIFQASTLHVNNPFEKNLPWKSSFENPYPQDPHIDMQCIFTY